MSRGINLLSAEQQLSAKIGSQKVKILRAVTLWSLFSISAISVVLSILIALSPLPLLQQQEQNVRVSLSAYHQDMAKLLLISDRLKGSEQILTTRSRFDQILEKIQERLPDDAEISGLTLNTSEIEVTVTSPSLVAIDTFLNNMVSAADEKKDFSRVILHRFFTNEETNAFFVTVEVVIL